MTILEKLQAQKTALEAQRPLEAPQLWLLQEITYRIGVIESCKAFQNAAPISADTQVLGPHYKVVDAYVQQLLQERQYGKPTDAAQQKQRETALASLNKVVADYRKRFQSYRPAAQEQYAADISRALKTVLPAWIQHRNCYINIKKEVEQ